MSIIYWFPKHRGVVVALEKTQEVGYLTSKKGSYNVGEVERIKKMNKIDGEK